MKICPKCQTEYDDTKNFCLYDGSPLEAKKAEGETAKGVDLTCPQCGKPVEAGKKFCRHCGARLEASTQPLGVEAGTAAPSFMHTKLLAEEKCSSCGTPVTSGKRFCRVCGARLEAPSPPSVSRLDPKTAAKIELLEKQLSEEPERVSVMVDLAECYLEAERARQAVELLERAVSHRGEDTRIRLLLGKARETAGDDQGALGAYLAALGKDAWSPEVEAALFREDFLLKTYPRSIEELSGIAARRGSVQIWRLLARVSEARGDHDRAAAFLTEAVRVKPDDVASLEALAQIYERHQEMKEAEKWHQRILEVNPGSRSSNLFFAQKHYAQGEYQEAIAYFERLLVGDRGNRLYQLYWLLANVKGYGVQGYENGIAEMLQWQNLTEEEKPLARELFVLAGKEHLKKGDFSSAEQHFLRAHHLSPSQDVASMLAVVEERKGEQAQREGDLSQALISYRRAAEYDPGNQTYVHKMARVMSLRAEESRRKRQAVQRKVARGVSLGLAVALLIVGGVFGYRKAREWFQTPSPQEELAVAAQKELASLSSEEPSSSPSTQIAGSSEATAEPEEKSEASSPVAKPPEGQPQIASAAEEKPQVPGEEPERVAKTTEPLEEEPRQGRVVTATELGIGVSGQGVGDPNRSPEVIQQEVEAYFSRLQETYERERTSDPSLMGSLVLDLTIEPDGITSQVRSQSAKITSKKFQEVVHDLAHEWRFSPASGEVKVYYPLLFLPPGMDAASIIAWEKSTAALETGRRRTEEARAPPEAEGPAHEHWHAERRIPEEREVKVPLGWYRVITPTPLRSEPRSDASVVTELRSGIRVRIVEAAGDYLKVYSRKGRPAGYVLREHVVLLRSE